MRRSAAWNAPQRRFEWPQRRPECVATAGDLPPAANGIVWHNALCAPLSVVSPHCFANYFAHLPFGRAPRAASGPCKRPSRLFPSALHRAFAYAECGRWGQRPSQLFPAHYTAHLLMRHAAAEGSGPPSYFSLTAPRICLCGMRPALQAALPVFSSVWRSPRPHARRSKRVIFDPL